MDKFIKNAPFISLIIFVLAIWLTSDVYYYSNAFIAALCGLVIFTLTGCVYIIMHRRGKAMIAARSYLLVMLGSGLLTFIVLYTGLEYFYS